MMTVAIQAGRPKPAEDNRRRSECRTKLAWVMPSDKEEDRRSNVVQSSAAGGFGLRVSTKLN